VIREIAEHEFVEAFFPLVAEVECGDHFRHTDPAHVKWLQDRIAVYYRRGARFFARYLDDGTPVGFIALLLDAPLEGVLCFGQYAEILSFGVVRERRGQGHGKELLAHAVSFACGSGAYCLYASTYARSHEVIAFYGRNGFSPVAVLPDVHGPNDEGTVWMRKILRDALTSADHSSFSRSS